MHQEVNKSRQQKALYVRISASDANAFQAKYT